MKIMYRGFYFYFGWNGFIIALEFDFKGKAYDVAFSLFAQRFDLNEGYPE